MKQYLFALIPALLVMFNACDRDGCENLVCNSSPNSVCINGACGCIQGYEGDFCDILSYEKYIGNYQVSENCQNTLGGPANQSYNLFISNTGGTQIDRVVLNNFAGRGLTVDAFINGDFITIPEQTIFGNTTINGNGQFIPGLNRMTIDYQIIQGSNYSECTGVFQRI